MKLFDIAFIAFFLFVANCLQFEKDQKRCEKAGYELAGCSIHKKAKELDKK
jgi:hypothetical protein